MTVTREETEIRDQAHEMWAEGTSGLMPDIVDIESLLLGLGWKASNVEVWYDNMQGFYRWNCSITKANN